MGLAEQSGPIRRHHGVDRQVAYDRSETVRAKTNVRAGFKAEPKSKDWIMRG